jgi:PPP family 3-phenylpropionic acid transporter
MNERVAGPVNRRAVIDCPVALSIGGFYAMFFLCRGVASPFFPLWLQDQGFSASRIAVLLAAPAIAGGFMGPLIAISCGVFHLPRTGLTAVALCGTAGLCVLALTSSLHDSGLMSVTWVVVMIIVQAQLPLIDVIAIDAARRAPPHYGLYRALGTLAYMVASLVGGALIGLFGSSFIVTWCALASAGSVVAIASFPRRQVNGIAPKVDPIAVTEPFVFWRSPAFIVLLVVTGLIEASHVYFFTFSSLIWRAEGFGPAAIGSLRAVCALSEVAFLIFCEPWSQRIGPRRLLAIAAIAGFVRWGSMAFLPPLWLALPLQILHALTYTATFLSAIQLARQIPGARAAALGQAIWAAWVGAFIPGAGSLLFGHFYDRLGADGYFVMAGIAASGGLAALLLIDRDRIRSRSLCRLPMRAGCDPLPKPSGGLGGET